MRSLSHQPLLTGLPWYLPWGSWYVLINLPNHSHCHITICVPSCKYFLFIIINIAAAAAKSLQSCSTLCDPIDGSPPGSSLPGILQARTLEWVAISFSSAWKWKVKVKSLSRVQPSANPWTAGYQAPPSMGFSRQEYWSGVPSLNPSKNVLYHPVFESIGSSIPKWGAKLSLRPKEAHQLWEIKDAINFPLCGLGWFLFSLHR